MGIAGVALGMQAASSVVGGMAAMGQARAERQRAENNAYIGETRALQTAAGIGEQLNSEIATLRATVASNGQGMTGALPFLREARRRRGREARIGVANERQGAADWRMQGQNAMAQGRAAMLGGILGAGPSLFEIYDRSLGPR